MWYYTTALGHSEGPISSDTLREYVREGEILPETLVSKDGRKWRQAGKIRQLFVDEAADPLPAPAKPPNVFVALPDQPLRSPTVKEIPCHFCQELVKARAVKCRWCGEFLDGRDRQRQPSIQTGPDPEICGILSLFVPGLGQFVSGKLITGLIYLILVPAAYFSAIGWGVILHMLCVRMASAPKPPPQRPYV